MCMMLRFLKLTLLLTLVFICLLSLSLDFFCTCLATNKADPSLSDPICSCLLIAFH